MLRLLMVVLLTGAAWGADANPLELSERARSLARAGSTGEALRLYGLALDAAPADVEIRRDYAIVLGWAERYADSIAEFKKVLEREPEQPDWAMRELARSELFGGSPAEALRILDALIRAGDDSELTLCRKAFALRWLNRPVEAERIYRQVAGVYPESVTARLGVVYSLADQNRLERALAVAEAALASQPKNTDLLKAKGQVLNWMGKHQAALRIFSAFGGSAAIDREVLEGRLAAARWGGAPKTAREAARELARTYPQSPAVKPLATEVALEYGRALAPSFRYATDNDGFIDRVYEQAFSLHAGPANRIQLGFQQRQFSMGESASWRRFDVGWSGTLAPRLHAYASVSDVEYRSAAAERRFVGDAALSFAINDSVKISGGGGTLAVDAFHAVQRAITAPFFYGNVVVEPWRMTAIEVQYSRYMFSNGINRDRFTVEGFRRLGGGRALHVDVGGAGNWMWHDRETQYFFSPATFHSLLAKARVAGRLSRTLEYNVEVGAGEQREAYYGRQSPFVATGSMFARLGPRLHLRVEAGRSTSSLERINPGRASYARTVVAAGLVFRFE